MKLDKVIFRESCEAPGVLSKVSYLQTTDPTRKDSIVRELEAHEFGVVADGELYPWTMIRRCTIAGRDPLANIPWADDAQPKRRGRPPKAPE